MSNPELSPFLQSIVDGTVKIESEKPLSLDHAVRASLNNLRLRVAGLLETQGGRRTDNVLMDTWGSPNRRTPLPLRMSPYNPRCMKVSERRYHVAEKPFYLDPTVLDLNLYSFSPRLPINARFVMIVAPSIAHLRGFLILTRMGNPPTQDTYGRLLVTHAPYPQRSSPSFVRFATPTDESHFGELVSLFEKATLPSNNGVSQIERYYRRYQRMNDIFYLRGRNILTRRV